MLDFVIFAVTFVVFLLGVVIYLYPGSSRPCTVPGMDPTTKEDGNLADISRAGSLHEFLVDLHDQYGSIASFWMGKQFIVSISSPELFKEHQNVFDRPPELFKMFEPLIGPQSIQYANKADGRKRRNNYDKVFTHQSIKRYYPLIQEVADELVKKWSTLVKEEHIALSQYMSAYALKVALLTMFGTAASDAEILGFRRNYDVCWYEMERRLAEPVPEPGSPRQKAFDEGRDAMKKFINKMVQKRKNKPPVGEAEILLDIFIDISDSEEQLFSEAISFAAGGFHTTGNVLTWGFYFLASHPEIQEKLYKEIKKVLGQNDLDASNISDLVYLRQFIDETLRCAVVAPFAARFQDFDSELGGHKIPKGTPVLQALGVSLYNEKYYPMPNKFDPDRFSPENSKSRPSLAFQPFGFAGKRICPGYRFAYSEASVCFVTLLKKFKVKMVEGQVINPVHGLVTHPDEEVWITIEKR